MEPLTSLMIRELRILARDFGRASRGFDEMARALRKHLQPEIESARMALNEEEVGTDPSRAQGEALSLPFPSLEEPESLKRSYD